MIRQRLELYIVERATGDNHETDRPPIVQQPEPSMSAATLPLDGEIGFYLILMT